MASLAGPEQQLFELIGAAGQRVGLNADVTRAADDTDLTLGRNASPSMRKLTIRSGLSAGLHSSGDG
jgi:hypothetical protein